MANDLNLGDLKITISTFEDKPAEAVFVLPNGSTVARHFPHNGELAMRLGLGLALNHLALLEAVAPPYVEPEETPDAPPGDSPTVLTPPEDTPTDPDSGEPEPGIDPTFSEPTRIEITDGKQTVIRTETDPGTWGNAYVAAELVGYDYWEIHVASSTPRNATLAVGVSNTLLPLNGIPGDLAGTVAYWSNGAVRNNAIDVTGFATFGKGDKISIARDKDTGRIWFAKNGVWLGSTPAVSGSGHQGTLTGSGPYYPFIALYSGTTQASFKFITSKFAYAAPDGFYPIGKTPTAPAQFQTGDWSVADAGTSGDITITITTLPSNGGSAITDLEYQIDGGSWVSLGGTTTGAYPVSGLTDGVEVDVAIRAVNAIGNGTASASKAVTSSHVDQHFANVALLLGFNGSDGSTTFTDESSYGHTATRNGNAQVDTAIVKYGTGALLLDGTTDSLGFAHHASFDVGSGDFVIEGWFNFANNTANQSLAAKWGSSRSWALQFLPAAIPSTPLRFIWSTNGTNTFSITANWTPTTGVWYHIAAVRSGGTAYVLVNGVVVASGSISGSLHNNNAVSILVGYISDGGDVEFIGSIDEFRMTVGVDRNYEAGFTPPTEAFPRS